MSGKEPDVIVTNAHIKKLEYIKGNYKVCKLFRVEKASRSL